MTRRAKNIPAGPNPIERYYEKWGWLYPLIWGESIHWGLFKTGLEPLCTATQQWTDRTIRLLQPRKGQKILEVGCGPAPTSHRLIEKYDVSVDAIDISKFQLRRAKTANTHFLKDGRLHLIKGDIARTALLPHAYDGAISEAVFFHLKEKKKSLQNIRKALRPGARFIFDDLILKAPIGRCDLRVAFGRFGSLKFLTQSSYSNMLQKTGFRLIETVSATDDVARTYERLLDKLEEQHVESKLPFTPQTYLNLRNSFREIIILLWWGKLASNIFVTTVA